MRAHGSLSCQSCGVVAQLGREQEWVVGGLLNSLCWGFYRDGHRGRELWGASYEMSLVCAGV